MKQIIHGKGEQTNQNVVIVNKTFTAIKAVKMLVQQGFTILRVLVTNGKPVIWIQTCDRCKQLNGVWYRQTGDASGTVYTVRADLEGTTVKWCANSLPGAA